MGSVTQSRSKKFAIVVAAAFALACSMGSAGAQGECSWGASSVTATLENGQFVETAPQTSGCT